MLSASVYSVMNGSCLFVIYIVSYRDHENKGILVRNDHLKTSLIFTYSDSLGILVRHSQAQKCLQMNSKPFH